MYRFEIQRICNKNRYAVKYDIGNCSHSYTNIVAGTIPTLSANCRVVNPFRRR